MSERAPTPLTVYVKHIAYTLRVMHSDRRHKRSLFYYLVKTDSVIVLD